MESIILTKGMHCKSCKILVEDSLLEEHGVKTVDVNFKTGHVKINYDDQVISLNKIKQIINKEGYEVIR